MALASRIVRPRFPRICANSPRFIQLEEHCQNIWSEDEISQRAGVNDFLDLLLGSGDLSSSYRKKTFRLRTSRS